MLNKEIIQELGENLSRESIVVDKRTLLDLIACTTVYLHTQENIDLEMKAYLQESVKNALSYLDEKMI